MATITEKPAQSPGLEHDAKLTTPDGSYSDEKVHYTDQDHPEKLAFTDNKEHLADNVKAAGYEVGDVFEEQRAIDLDESGKERPIGRSYRKLYILHLSYHHHRNRPGLCPAPTLLGR